MAGEARIVVCVEREHGTYKSCSRQLNSAFGNSISLVHFATAREALAYLSSNRADLVISSLLQAEIDGIDLLNACKELYPGMPFVIHTNLNYKEDFFAWGFKPDAYVVREQDPSGLIDAVGSLLDIKADRQP